MNKKEEYDGPMGNYKVIGQIPFTDEVGKEEGFLEVDSMQTVPCILGDVWVEKGLAEKMTDIASPFMQPVGFDYNKQREETVLPAIKAIYKIWAEEADNLVFSNEATKEEIVDKQGIVVQKMLMAIVENKVIETDMKFLAENFQATVFMLFDTISRQKNELEKEYYARTLGVRDPGTGKFSKEQSTLGDMFVALEKIRNEQDTEENQYFIVKKK